VTWQRYWQFSPLVSSKSFQPHHVLLVLGGKVRRSFLLAHSCVVVHWRCFAPLITMSLGIPAEARFWGLWKIDKVHPYVLGRAQRRLRMLLGTASGQPDDCSPGAGVAVYATLLLGEKRWQCSSVPNKDAWESAEGILLRRMSCDSNAPCLLLLICMV
jgi:hypothetical protein